MFVVSSIFGLVGVVEAQDDPRRFTITGMVAGNLTTAFGSARAAAAAKGRFEEELERARARFWALYPKSPGIDAAAAELTAMLFEKDRYYLTLVAPGRVDRDMGRRSALFSALTGGSVDGSIPAAAIPAFNAWVDSVLASTTERVAGLPLITAEAIQSPRSVAAYRIYSVIRDLDEYLRGPLSPLVSNDHKLFLTGVLVRGLELPTWSEGEREYTALVDVLGEVDAKAAATALKGALTPQQWRHPRIYNVFNQGPPVRYLWNVAASRERTAIDDRKFMMALLGRSGDNQSWSEAKRRYEELVQRFGEPLVGRLAAAVRGGAIFPPPCVTSPWEQYRACLHRALSGGDAAISAAIVLRNEVDARARAAAADSAKMENNAYWEAEAEKQGVVEWRRRQWIFEQRTRRIHNVWDYSPWAMPIQNAIGHFWTPDDQRHPDYRRTEARDRTHAEALEKAIGELRVSCDRATNKRSAPCLLLPIAEETYRDLPIKR
jgi:hypothetical protein